MKRKCICGSKKISCINGKLFCEKCGLRQVEMEKELFKKNSEFVEKLLKEIIEYEDSENLDNSENFFDLTTK